MKELLKTFECCPECSAKIQSTEVDFNSVWHAYTGCTKCEWSHVEPLDEDIKHCYYCGLVCNDSSCNPSDWSVPLCHSDEPGKVKYHHTRCVSERLEKLKANRNYFKKSKLRS